MKSKTLVLLTAAFAGFALTSQATTYSGNGDTSWGGPVGSGLLTLTDDSSTLNLTFAKGVSGDLGNNALVIYLDTVSGGFSDTSTLADTADGGRSAISGYSSSGRSTLTFASGFNPDYAVSIEGTYASLFQLNSGGDNSLTWITGAGQSGSGSATFTLSIPISDLGLTSGQSLELFGTLTSTSAYRSTEAIAGADTGVVGWTPFTQTAFSTYTTAVPEPSTLALLGLSGALASRTLRRRR